jgi:hypothetical protein
MRRATAARAAGTRSPIPYGCSDCGGHTQRISSLPGSIARALPDLLIFCNSSNFELRSGLSYGTLAPLKSGDSI